MNPELGFPCQGVYDRTRGREPIANPRTGTTSFIALLGCGVIACLAFAPAAAATLNVQMPPPGIHGKLLISELTPAPDALTITWNPATQVSRFTNPAGLVLDSKQDDPSDGFGGANGCQQLSTTEIDCGLLTYRFSDSGTQISLGSGNDVLRVDRDLPQADVGAIHPQGMEVDGGPGADQINGTDGNDFLIGGPGRDRIFGFGDMDQLFGCGGNDLLNGGGVNGPEANMLPKFARVNDLFGGPGKDKLVRGQKAFRDVRCTTL